MDNNEVIVDSKQHNVNFSFKGELSLKTTKMQLPLIRKTIQYLLIKMKAIFRKLTVFINKISKRLQLA